MKWADQQFAEMGAKIILCFKDVVTEKDDLISSDKYEEIKNAYFNLNLKTPIIRLNTTDENLNREILEICVGLAADELRKGIRNENNLS